MEGGCASAEPTVLPRPGAASSGACRPAAGSKRSMVGPALTPRFRPRRGGPVGSGKGGDPRSSSGVAERPALVVLRWRQ